MPLKFPRSLCFGRHPLPVVSQHSPISDPPGDNAVSVDTVFQGTIIRNEPAYRQRPLTMPGYHRFNNGDYDAFVAIAALEAIADKTRQAAPNEMIGYLAGRPFHDGKGPYAVVTEAIFAESARCGPAAVETSLEDERGLLATLLADHPLADRLGWFHSHPFDMPKYSSTDLENQRFWSEPYQLGLLACLDGSRSVSIFGFRGPEAEAIRPCYTSGPSHPNSMPPFRPLLPTAQCQPAPQPAEPPKLTTVHRSSLALLTLAVGVVWPLIYLLGVHMVVETMRGGRDGPAQSVAVGTDAAAAARQSPDAPAKLASPGASKVATPVKSAEQSSQNRQ